MKACNRIIFYGIPLVLCLLSVTSYAQNSIARNEKTLPVQAAVLKDIKVSEEQKVIRIEITADKPFNYMKYSITEPPQAIVDLYSTDIGNVKIPIVNESKIVKGIELSKKNTERELQTRVIFNLKKNTDFSVTQDGANRNRIIVSITDNVQNLKTVSLINIDPPKQKPVLFSQNQKIVENSGANKEKILGNKKLDTQMTETNPTLLADADSKMTVTADQKNVADSANKWNESVTKNEKKIISALNITSEGIEIIANSEIVSYKSFRMSKPQRLIVDMYDVTTTIKGNVVPVNRFGVGKARLGVYPGKVRIVFDAPGNNFPKYKFENSAKGLNVVFAALDRDKKSATDKDAAVSENVQKSTDSEKQANLSIESIDFKIVDGYSRVIVKANGTLNIGRPNKTAKGILLTAKNCILPNKLQRPFDTKAFEGTVMSITPYQVRTRAGFDTKILVKLRKDAPYKLKSEGNIVLLDVKNEEMPESYAQDSAVQRSHKVSPYKTPSTGNKETVGSQLTTGKKVYTGARVTLEFADADIRKIFQLIAEVSNLNFLLGDDVTGTISIKLVNVPWDQALDVILETKGLGMKREGNIVVIRPLSKIQTLADEKQAERKASEKAMDLKTRVFDVNYAASKDIASQFKTVQSERGIIAEDTRTNRVIVTDIEPAIEKMAFILKALDLPERQVVIEARIVEASTTVTQDFGIQWGLHATNVNTLGITDVDAGGGGVLSAGTIGTSGTFGPGVATGITFGKIISGGTLDLQLSALATAELIKIISTPKVVTLNNKAAKIIQGDQIPYQTVSAEGTQTQFVEAALSLEVTPHITSDGSVSMKIKASNNSAGSGSPPPIHKKEATTELLVKNGETTVIGGVYQDSDTTEDQGVPFLKDIPLLGWLFKSKDTNKKKTELLIFITPKIVL